MKKSIITWLLRFSYLGIFLSLISIYRLIFHYSNKLSDERLIKDFALLTISILIVFIIKKNQYDKKN